MTGSKYSDLPKDVEVPKSGKLFENPKAALQGKAGKLIRVLVNHFEIQSLPTVKTYAFDVGRPSLVL